MLHVSFQNKMVWISTSVDAMERVRFCYCFDNDQVDDVKDVCTFSWVSLVVEAELPSPQDPWIEKTDGPRRSRNPGTRGMERKQRGDESCCESGCEGNR